MRLALKFKGFDAKRKDKNQRVLKGLSILGKDEVSSSNLDISSKNSEVLFGVFLFSPLLL